MLSSKSQISVLNMKTDPSKIGDLAQPVLMAGTVLY